jgi:hypothetical protein
MTKRGRVRVETDRESPRTYDVGRNEEVTVRTRHEKPEVTGGGGGGGGSDVGGTLGCLAIFVIFIAIVVLTIGYFVDRAVNLVEHSVIKKISPDYKTRAETTEEEIEKKTKIADEETEKREKEIEESIENIEIGLENFRIKQAMKLINKAEVENVLSKKGYLFYVGYPSGFYVLNDNIWICGDLFYDKENCYYSAIAFSDNRGKDYKILRIFKEPGRIEYPEKSISTLFLPVMGSGYLSIYGTDGFSVVYKARDRGYSYNWEMILSTRAANVTNNFKIGNTKIIRILAGKISLILSFQKDGLFESIESNDDGDSWSYKRNYKAMAKTYYKGLIWEAP